MSKWRPMNEVPIDIWTNEKTIICKWILNDGSILIGAARWVAPNPSQLRHWAYEGKWTPIDPIGWQEMPEE